MGNLAIGVKNHGIWYGIGWIEHGYLIIFIQRHREGLSVLVHKILYRISIIPAVHCNNAYFIPKVLF